MAQWQIKYDYGVWLNATPAIAAAMALAGYPVRLHGGDGVPFWADMEEEDDATL
jgi:hypothetical protein